MNITTLAIALDLATRGLPVFPCTQEKKPAIGKHQGGSGFLDASHDPAVIRRMFARRNAVLVGVPTGELSGFDVLDLDYRHDAAAWETANAHRLPETRIHESQSGGRHLLFQHAPGVRNSAAKVAPGVDVRGEGGYVIMPPSPGYRLISEAPIAHWPDWLLLLALPPLGPPAAPSQSGAGGAPAGQNSERLDRIIQSALDRVRTAPEGGKHFTLRNTALLLGGVAEQAGFNDETAICWLLDALPRSVQNWNAAATTAAWGMEHGRARPIDIPDKAEPKPVDPRRRETARAAFRLLKKGLPSAELLAALHDLNQRRAAPLPAHVITTTALWAARQRRGRAHGR